ncbi:substrate-binding domain-containing protein [Nocardia fusca]|uniref:substrate-binding domain-containing protein n=1 Tax=Nocardia fusca TaxID=941183 RepID=UPI0007A74A33|nr:substrate-binding domain-containing protein [Nocardia fusca]
MHNSRGDTEVPVVGGDHVGAGRLAAGHLIDVHRCEKLVFVGGFTAGDVRHGDRETVAQRLRGFTAALGGHGHAIRTDLTAATAYTAVGTYLRGCPEPPQGMASEPSAQSAAAMRAVTDAGLRIPEDVRIVGFDGATADYFGQITLTSVRRPVDLITRRALARLLDPPDGRGMERSGPKDVALGVGESCGCHPLPAHLGAH